VSPFEHLIAHFAPEPDVTLGTGFGSSRGLRVRGRIFAIFGDEALTVKLPRTRVDELVADGIGARFDPGHGRIMREWITVPAANEDSWDALADEAMNFVSSLS